LANPETGTVVPSDIHLGAAESQAIIRELERKQTLFTLLNSSGLIPPT
jgi:hypothetical protein